MQGDEPLLDPGGHRRRRGRRCSRSRDRDGDAPPAVRDEDELRNPNVVKVVSDRAALRLFFTRAIPHGRDASALDLGARSHRSLRLPARTLLRLAGLPPGDVEQIEGLEQLRALENGIRISVVDTHESSEVDTPEDLARARMADSKMNLWKTTDQIHLRDRRRGVVARQGPGGGFDRRAARGPRLQGHAAEVRPLHQRRSGHDEPVPARRGLRHR